MSYARFGSDSDVYIYSSVGYKHPNSLVCCGCNLKMNAGLSVIAMLMHIQAHINNGDVVPDYAIFRLIEELDTNTVTYNFRFNSNIIKSKVLRNFGHKIKYRYLEFKADDND